MVSASVARDMGLAREYIPHMKRILANYLIVEAPFEEDTKRNTDLVVLTLDAVRIGCRVRRHEYAEPYGDEFTIRAGRPSGVKTELAKILEGWGDYILYGFENDRRDDLCAWLLGDLGIFRQWFYRQLRGRPYGDLPGREIENHDGSSTFRVFRVDELPPDFVLARSVYSS